MTLGLFLFCVQVNAQISTREEPVSFKTNIPVLRTSEISMKSFVSLDMKKIEREDIEDEANGIPTEKIRLIYSILKMKEAPFIRKKSVVLKIEPDKCGKVEKQRDTS